MNLYITQDWFLFVFLPVTQLKEEKEEEEE